MTQYLYKCSGSGKIRTEESIVSFGTAYRMERVQCPVCKRIVAAKTDGTLRTHNMPELSSPVGRTHRAAMRDSAASDPAYRAALGRLKRMTNRGDIIKRKCGYRDCAREAARGWTMCFRHYTAGGSAAHKAQADAARLRRVSLDRLRDHIKELEALTAFAAHSPTCGRYGEEFDASMSDVCSCGLDAALSAVGDVDGDMG